MDRRWMSRRRFCRFGPVGLKKLTREQAGVFMEIEYPQGGPIALTGETFDTIGEFYEAILQAFKDLNPPLNVSRQL
ncbi:MAG: hypothetical protein KDA84_01380, partial [Planctomycetaceae bacterium]|nr:hypothetical protein [Planctomycetaceae bacterium]